MATPRRPSKPRRSKVAQNIVANTPASGWTLATAKQKQILDVNPKEPRYIRKGVKFHKGAINLTRDEFTKKAFGLHRRKLAEARAAPAIEGRLSGAEHPVYGYKRRLTAKVKALINERRRVFTFPVLQGVDHRVPIAVFDPRLRAA